MVRSHFVSRLSLGALAVAFVGSAHALTFNFTGTVPTNVANGFAAAGARWAAIFSDPITVNVNIGFPSLGPGILGSTGTSMFSTSYSNYRNALSTDSTSADDATAVTSLPNTTSITTQIDRTSTNAALHSITTSSAYISRANAKAVGLLGASGVSDATINFSSNFSWDFDPSNGITAGQYDFVGVATHEIGHAMGFLSVVDYLVSFAPGQSDAYYAARINSLDYFRFTSSGTRSIASGTTGAKYFSINNGVTNHSNFSLGASFGDGRQASHWKDNLGIGIMDPTAAPGELLAISANDRRGFDVIGWTLSGAMMEPVPEPATMIGLAGAFAALMARRRRKQS